MLRRCDGGEQGCGAVDDGRGCCGDVMGERAGMLLWKSATRTRFQLIPDCVRGLDDVAVCTATRCRWRNEVMSGASAAMLRNA